MNLIYVFAVVVSLAVVAIAVLATFELNQSKVLDSFPYLSAIVVIVSLFLAFGYAISPTS